MPTVSQPLPSVSGASGEVRQHTRAARFSGGGHTGSGSPQVIAVGDELDEPMVPFVAPVVEPEYGFADDVGGAISLNLLVNDRGHVVFDLVVSNDLDEPTTTYLRQQFRALRFRPPTAKGKPVYAWLSYVVHIQRKITQ